MLVTARVRGFGRLVSRFARRLAIVPLRAKGLLLVGAGAYVSFGVGREEADYLLYPAGMCAIGLVGVCALCVTAGALRLWLAVRRVPAGLPLALDTGQAFRTELVIPRLAWWPLVDVR